jgi:spore coat protein U domain-containing protein, fimbrial subunit CupE1/2/3/6
VSRCLCAALLFLAPTLACAQVICGFLSTPGAAFGVYDDGAPAAANTSTSVVVRCLRNGGPANVTLTLQIGPSAGTGQIVNRALSAGAERLAYNLYRDASRTAVWGQTAGVDTVAVAINGVPNNGSKDATFVVYGRIPALQSVAAGAYADSVQLTISP